jgi:hypothetical protein
MERGCFSIEPSANEGKNETKAQAHLDFILRDFLIIILFILFLIEIFMILIFGFI